LLETIDLIRNNLGHPLRVAGAVVTMFDKREHLSREVAKNLRANFPHHVFDVEIPRSVALAEAPSFSKPIIIYDSNSPGAIGYRRLAAEVIDQEQSFMLPASAIASENFGEFNL
jgi:chromosome partitioning protein